MPDHLALLNKAWSEDNVLYQAPNCLLGSGVLIEPNLPETDGETVETVSDFTFWGSKITADGWLQPWN